MADRAWTVTGAVMGVVRVKGSWWLLRRVGSVGLALPRRGAHSRDPVYAQSQLTGSRCNFSRKNRLLPRSTGTVRQPVFLASQGIIHYRNERLQPESEPSES
jgi:hypothetical protein